MAASEPTRTPGPTPPTSTHEVFQWLKNLPLAPEYRPTLAEFQDPIAYIFKIEKEASQYGICKIVPPVLQAPKKTAISNLNRSLSARTADSRPTFTTRQQQIGFCPRKPRPVQRPVWQSGESYTLQEFEAKAKSFERNYLKKGSTRKGPTSSSSLSALEIETLYWKATLDKPFSVEYANDMPGSAFSKRKDGGGGALGEGVTVGETEWNMRGVSRAKGSLLRFMKEEIPGVTSPMVYVGMMFSWFAWHVEDHDLHSLNYMHMGAGKTWYGVPREAAAAFEEVVRVHGYGGELNPLVTFAVLGEKTTVMSPEVFIRAGVPCCRLVQNVGEFVVTFPRAYHSGFSHGFNCGEAANIATPEWLRVAKDSAIRRASINYPPMVSHFQLLYDLALECTRVPLSITAKPRSSRLKNKKKSEGEALVKELFVNNIIQNNELLHTLGKGSSVVLLPRSSSDISVCSNLRVGSHLRENPSFGLFSRKDFMFSSKCAVSDDMVPDGNHELNQAKGFLSMKAKFASLCENDRFSSLNGNGNAQNSNAGAERGNDALSNQRLFSCVTCGILSFDCLAVIQPREAAARYLMSADCSFFNDWTVSSGLQNDGFSFSVVDANTSEQNQPTRLLGMNVADGLYKIPVHSTSYQIQIADEVASTTKTEKETSALGLLAMTYGNSSDSDDEEIEHDQAQKIEEFNTINCSSESKYKCQNPDFCSSMQKCQVGRPAQCCHGEDGFSSQSINCREEHGHEGATLDDRSDQPLGCSLDNTFASMGSNSLDAAYKDSLPLADRLSNSFPQVHRIENSNYCRAILPPEKAETSFHQRSDDDSSRVHVFCLEHAVEIEQQLRAIGGVHILLLCHPEYPRIEAEAKILSQELGIDHIWNDITFRDAKKEDEARIQLALDSEEAIPGNGDWAVKLGINLFYSANLSRSPLYSKQMPYNSVIYNAFGRASPASSPTKLNACGKRSSRQRKVVVGKWCGKVWMSNQVHALLATQGSEEQDLDQELSSRDWALTDGKIERKPQTLPKTETTLVNKKSGKKRKVTAESRPVKKVKRVERDYDASDDSEQLTMVYNSKQRKSFDRGASYDPLEYTFDRERKRILRSKLARSVEREDSASDDPSNENILQRCSRLSRSKIAKSIQRDNVASYALVESSSKKQHKRIHGRNQAKWVEKESEVSDASLEDINHRWDGRVSKSTLAKLMEREDSVSDDSLEESSHRSHKRVAGSKQTRYMEDEDDASDDSLPNTSSYRNRRGSISMHAGSSGMEDAVSDDSMHGNNSLQQSSFRRGKQAKFVESDDEVSDDSLEESLRHQHRKALSNKQASFAVAEDADSDDSLGDNTLQQLRRIPRSKRNKFIDTEMPGKDTTTRRRIPRGKKAQSVEKEDISDNLQEDTTGLRSSTGRNKRGKLVKLIEEDDAVSDDLVGSNSDQQNSRTLRSKKQRKSVTLRQMKEETSRRSKQEAPKMRRETPQLIKQERQVKQETPQLRNVKNMQNPRQPDLQEEEVEGGPSTRLRKRPSKPPKEEETKIKEKHQNSGKRVKNASAVKAAAGRNNAKAKDEVKYQCDIDGCTMSFSSKQELAVHKRNVCPVKGCGKKFFSHKYLVQHRRVHIDDRPLKCPWKGCKMTFKWAWARTEHIRVHTGARPYKCAECEQTFRFVSDFSRHKRRTGHLAKEGRV
ncbi:hypothetical protein Tsubulata_030824 [Turnera subulata]|uniref:Lysine-specific demethylase REF6 n=1 Tax=Turnera subulata TaxID=218843 RepID=A0A9Q0G0D2_9ROSI|nr:hypothetical protein Tsubulata_030824 [Turnera subulata]